MTSGIANNNEVQRALWALDRAAQACRDTASAAQRAVERRNQAVVEARAAGLSHAAIARRLGLTQPRIVQIAGGAR